MPLVTIDTNPTRRQLAVFGGAWLAVFALAAAGVWRSGGGPVVWGGLSAVAVAVPFAGLLWRPALRWTYIAAGVVVWPIGAVVSVLLLAGVYYLLVTPIGLALRLFGRDAMGRRFPAETPTCWSPRTERRARRPFRQF